MERTFGGGGAMMEGRQAKGFEQNGKISHERTITADWGTPAITC